MAKKRKYPKRPKTSSSLEVWERYKKRCQEVDKYNSKLDADKKKKEKLISSIRNSY